QTLRAGINHIDSVFITHQHMDHIAGLDDLRPFCHQQKQHLPVYSTREGLDSIINRFDYMFGPSRYPTATKLDLYEMTKQITLGDVTVTPLPAQHGKVGVLGFRFNNISYFSDVKMI